MAESRGWTMVASFCTKSSEMPPVIGGATYRRIPRMNRYFVTSRRNGSQNAVIFDARAVWSAKIMSVRKFRLNSVNRVSGCIGGVRTGVQDGL
jgi:hypothetical protein